MGWNGLTCLILPMPHGCCSHHVTYESCPYGTVFVHALGILGQLEWPLAGGLMLGRRPPLQCILLVRGRQRVQTSLQNALPRSYDPLQLWLVGPGLVGKCCRLD